jgi:hypothetical protein
MTALKPPVMCESHLPGFHPPNMVRSVARSPPAGEIDVLPINVGRVPSAAVPTLGRVVIFGTYDEKQHPRVRVLREGLTVLGYPVDVVNVPFDLDTAARVRLVSQPWRAALVALRLARAWAGLIVRSHRAKAPAAVIVGYLGALDIHLARLRWPRAHLVLDQMVSLAETLADRGLDSSPTLTRLLTRIDRAPTMAARPMSNSPYGRADELFQASADFIGLGVDTPHISRLVAPIAERDAADIPDWTRTPKP